MIIDTLDQRHRYADKPTLATMLDALANLPQDVEAGTHVDLGEGGHINVAEFTSLSPEQQTRFEAHRTYADVHVVLEGAERIDIASLAALDQATEFDEAADIGFHTGEPTVSLVLEPGWFVVCYPADAHRPGVWVDGPVPVRKAVGKLRVG